MIAIYVEKKAAANSIASALHAGKFISVKNLTAKKIGILGYWKFSWRGEETYIIYGVGHLTQLCDAPDYSEQYQTWGLTNFPCIPQKYKTKPQKATLDYYKFAADILKKASLIISATDPDREGQVVFEYLYKTVGCTAPYKRAWLPSDLTPEKIVAAFDSLEDSSAHYPLTLAGIARSVADWTIGINLTVAATLKFGGKELMNVGRVQTAVLALVAERTKRIENFKSEPFWKVAISCQTQPKFEAMLSKPELFRNEQEALDICERCKKIGIGTVESYKTNVTQRKKPLLYSTTELQIAIHNQFGYTVKNIAEIMESLYNHHFITYPRTESNVLSSNLMEESKQIIRLLMNGSYSHLNREESTWAPFTTRHFNDKLIEKTGDSHTAIIPTLTIPKENELSEEQKNVYDFIAKSLISIAYDDAQIENQTVTISVGEFSFSAKGSTVLNYDTSWFQVVGQKKPNALPLLQQGTKVPFEAIVKKGETRPEPYYTQASLLKQMMFVSNVIDDEDVAAFMKAKECGLGTGGTRPQIVGNLFANNLLRIEKKHVIPTEKGYWLLDHIPDELKMIKDAKTTGVWEQRLNQIATSDVPTAKLMAAGFIKSICDATRKYFDIVANQRDDFFSETESAKKQNGSMYSCPKCGQPLHRFKWGFGCSGYKNGCDFRLGIFRNKKLTENQMISLITNRTTSKIKFKSKEGNPYEGYLILNDKNEVEFTFNKDEERNS